VEALAAADLPALNRVLGAIDLGPGDRPGRFVFFAGRGFNGFLTLGRY
jgi:hypothetical protein